ncbi:MAG: 7TM diverse intracellular signaling domain-containing protein [Ramlibacter sp.]
MSSAAWSQAARTHSAAKDTPRIDLAASVGVLEDLTGNRTAAEVAALAASGVMRPAAYPKSAMLRTHAVSTLWLKIDVAAAASAPRQWLLAAGWPVHDRVRLYLQSADGSWAASPETGARVPMSAREVPNRSFVFPVELEPGRTQAMLLRIQDSGESPIDLELWQPEAFHAADRATENLYILYFGIYAGLLFYNLLLFVVVRDRRYLTYTAFITTIALAVAGNTGIGAVHMWGDWGGWWNSRFTHIAYSLVIAYSATFTRHFLSTRQRLPAVDQVLRVATWMGIAAAAASAALPKFLADVLIIPGSFVLTVTTIGLSVFAVVRRWPGAAYYGAACMAFQLSAFVAALRFTQAVDWNITVPGAVAFGSSLEMILLSLALADRINEERRLKEQAQAHAMALLRASQALSTETRLDRLYARLCGVMAEVAGATDVQFVVRENAADRWFLHDGPEGGEPLSVDEAGARGLLCASAFRWVRSSSQSLVVADAREDPRFSTDPRFAGVACCSLLALPIVHHGAAVAVLILENRGQRGAFSDVSLAAVEAVAGPLAVSLENVLLYEHQEQRVEEQTRALRETQHKLLATARRAGMAEIATNVLHNVGNTLNSVNVATHLMRTRLAGSRLQGLARAVDLLDEHREDLGAFLLNDSKGRILPEYLRKLSMVLEEERQELLEHLGRQATSVDHIKNVVATQQSYAGPSVLTEEVRPSELIEDALRIASNAVPGEGLEVVKDFVDLPAVRLDKTRAVQILVNLMTNARQAMEGLAADARKLTLRLETAGGKLRFQVGDAGCGIRQEHLPRIFSHGFTTREAGHGFGLHSCAVAAGEMGGSIAVQSEGEGRGATFTLELPLVPAGRS